jgi:hypothetical protein
MKTNVGGIDRIIRIIAGILILGVGYYFRSWWGLIGLLPLLTGIVRICPGYLPFGFNTGRAPEEKSPPPAKTTAT